MKKHVDSVIHELKHSKRQVINTGIQNLDYLTEGLAKGDLIILGARPWTGRSAFLSRLLQRAV